MIRWNARKAGRSGAKVSRICLGTMNFGAVTSEPDAHAIMGSAHSRGINFSTRRASIGPDRASFTIAWRPPAASVLSR